MICPTRELAIQVAGEAERFGALPRRCAPSLAYGGTSSGDQKRTLGAGRATSWSARPGRLLDFVNSAWLSHAQACAALVLDEADRMLDMGFIDDVDAILRRSADEPADDALLGHPSRRDPPRSPSATCSTRRGRAMHRGTRRHGHGRARALSGARRAEAGLLLELLRRERPAKALIFTATREGTSELALTLRARGTRSLAVEPAVAGQPRARARRVPQRRVPRPRRHRRGRTRARHHGHRSRGQLRRADARPRTTSTASAAPGAWSARAGRSRSSRESRSRRRARHRAAAGRAVPRIELEGFAPHPAAGAAATDPREPAAETPPRSRRRAGSAR